MRPGWMFPKIFEHETFRLPLLQTILAFFCGLFGLALGSFSFGKFRGVSAVIFLYASAIFFGFNGLVFIPIGVVGLAFYGLGLLVLIPIVASYEFFKEVSRLLGVLSVKTGVKWGFICPMAFILHAFIWQGPELWIGSVFTKATQFYRVERMPPDSWNYKILRHLAHISPSIAYGEAERRETELLYRSEFPKIYLDLTGELPPVRKKAY